MNKIAQASQILDDPAIGQMRLYPQLRFMGSKRRLLPWIHDVLSRIEFDSVLDTCSGSGCVSYLLKTMGKCVTANDFLNFSAVITKATVENPGKTLSEEDLQFLLAYDPTHPKFIERTFTGIFYTQKDLRFLDRVWWNIRKFKCQYKRSLAISALIRSCAKRQPRGVFTVAGDPERYKDGRRDVRLSIKEHFLEQVQAYNAASFDNERCNESICGDVFDVAPVDYDLVYIDPPYVPRSDDNCYVKRYHFLEGLSDYWDSREIMKDSRVKKLPKPFTPFSYRRTAIDAFSRLFAKFSSSTIVLSYSSNGFPDLDILVHEMGKHKNVVTVHGRDHRYHFGTHSTARRNNVTEYLIVGS